MWIPSFISALAKHIDTESSRYALGSFLVEHWSDMSMTRYSATDGRQMICVTKPGDPVSENAKESAGRFSRILVDGSSLAAAAKAAASGVKHGCLALCEVSKALAVRCFHTPKAAKRGKITAEVELGQGRFPDIVQVFEKLVAEIDDGTTEYHSVLLDPRQLKKYCETVIAAHKNACSEPMVRLFVASKPEFANGNPTVECSGGMVAYTETAASEAIHWVCMPMCEKDPQKWGQAVTVRRVLDSVSARTDKDRQVDSNNSKGLENAA